MNRRRSMQFVLASTAWAVSTPKVFGQAYPTKPIMLIVPFAPGGSTDLLGRALAERLGKLLRVPIVVENRPGAGTAVAAELVARAQPDGYTLFLASSSTLVFNPLMGGAHRYDPVRDFAGVSLLASAPTVMVVPASLEVSTVDELIALARRMGDRLTFGSAGQGSALHLAAEMFLSMTGLRMAHVPYRGSAQALNGLLANEIQLYFDLIPTSRPLIQSGKLRALAVTGRTRVAALAGVPTLIECGFAGYEATSSFALVAPRATPTAVIRQLHSALLAVLVDAQLVRQFAELGIELLASAEPELVATHFQEERSRWQPVIRARGIRLDN